MTNLTSINLRKEKIVRMCSYQLEMNAARLLKDMGGTFFEPFLNLLAYL